MKTRKSAISFIWVTVLVTMVASCQVIDQGTEARLKSQEKVVRDLPVIGSKSKDGSAFKIKVVPTVPPKIVTLSAVLLSGFSSFFFHELLYFEFRQPTDLTCMNLNGSDLVF